MPKVAILYGFGEGDYQGRAFVSELKKAGFDVIRDEHAADILITHSAGCWFLPPEYTGQKLVFIGAPYWPGKSLATASIQKIFIDFWDLTRHGHSLEWVIKTLFNLIYIVRYITLWTFLGRYKVRKQRFFTALKGSDAYLVRNDKDPFLTPEASTLLSNQLGKTVMVANFEGQHDSCWHDPKPYVEFIQNIARKVL